MKTLFLLIIDVKVQLFNLIDVVSEEHAVTPV